MENQASPALHETQQTLPYGAPLYNEAMQFFFEEAQLLDDGLLDGWLRLLTTDFVYRMPVRQLVSRAAGSGFDPNMMWVQDDIAATAFKVKRYMETDTAWAEDPPSFTRRYVTNLLLKSTDRTDELAARTSVLTYRKRGADESRLVSAMRNDILRKEEGRWKLARREVLIDQSSVDMANIAIFI